jgi:hypothetical protein
MGRVPSKLVTTNPARRPGLMELIPGLVELIPGLVELIPGLVELISGLVELIPGTFLPVPVWAARMATLVSSGNAWFPRNHLDTKMSPLLIKQSIQWSLPPYSPPLYPPPPYRPH